MPLNIEEFANLLEARVVLKDSQTEHNTYRLHQSLGGLTPTEYATHWEAQHQPTLPQHMDPQSGSPATLVALSTLPQHMDPQTGPRQR